MTFSQTMGVIPGADIGTTITAQMSAFKLTDYALLMIAVGFGLRMFAKTFLSACGQDHVSDFQTGGKLKSIAGSVKHAISKVALMGASVNT